MCSSPRSPSSPAADAGDRLGTVAGGLALGVAAGLAAWLGTRAAWAPPPGEVRIQPETVLRIALAPAPEIAPEPPPAPEMLPEPPPEPEPLPEPEESPEPVPVPEPPPPEPVPAPERPPPMPVAEAAPAVAAQPEADAEGAAGMEDAIRAEWLGELRRRIERNKFYPGAARYARETGTVRARVSIGADGTIGRAEILENSGPPLLAEGARGILRRAAATPLGTNELRAGFQVDVPITYCFERR